MQRQWIWSSQASLLGVALDGYDLDADVQQGREIRMLTLAYYVAWTVGLLLHTRSFLGWRSMDCLRESRGVDILVHAMTGQFVLARDPHTRKLKVRRELKDVASQGCPGGASK